MSQSRQNIKYLEEFSSASVNKKKKMRDKAVIYFAGKDFNKNSITAILNDPDFVKNDPNAITESSLRQNFNKKLFKEALENQKIVRDVDGIDNKGYNLLKDFTRDIENYFSNLIQSDENFRSSTISKIKKVQYKLILFFRDKKYQLIS